MPVITRQQAVKKIAAAPARRKPPTPDSSIKKAPVKKATASGSKAIKLSSDARKSAAPKSESSSSVDSSSESGSSSPQLTDTDDDLDKPAASFSGLPKNTAREQKPNMKTRAGKQTPQQPTAPVCKFSFKNRPTWSGVRGKVELPAKRDMRVDDFKNNNPYRAIYTCSYNDVIPRLQALPLNASLASDSWPCMVTQVKILLKKRLHSGGHLVGMKKLRANLRDGPCTVAVILAFQPMFASRFAGYQQNRLEYSIIGYDSPYDCVNVTENQEVQLTTAQYKFCTPRRMKLNSGYFGLNEMNIEDYVDTNGSLDIQIAVNYRLTKLAYLYADEKLSIRKALARNEMDNMGTEIDVVCKPDGKLVHQVSVGHVPLGLLAETSPVIKVVFDNNTTIEAKTNRIVISDFSRDALSQFVQYIWYGPRVIILDKRNILELAYLADKYEMFDLLFLCQTVMMLTISADTVVQYYMAAVMMNLTIIKNACMVAVKHNGWGDVICDGAFWCDAFEKGKATAQKALTELMLYLRNSN